MSVPVRRVDLYVMRHMKFTQGESKQTPRCRGSLLSTGCVAVVLLEERLPTLITRPAVTTFSGVDKLMNHKRLTSRTHTDKLRHLCESQWEERSDRESITPYLRKEPMTRLIWITLHTRKNVSSLPLITEHQPSNPERGLSEDKLLFVQPHVEAVSLSREVVETEKKALDELRDVPDSHDGRLIHRVASDLRPHGIRRNETVLDGGDNLILVRSGHTVAQACHEMLPTFDERLSQRRDGFQTTARQVEGASFIVKCAHLQIHRLAKFRSCVGKEQHWEGLRSPDTSSRRQNCTTIRRAAHRRA